jgi:nitrogen fixation NifU-like protein
VRIKCANLAWHALKYALESPEPQANGSAFVSNENTD